MKGSSRLTRVPKPLGQLQPMCLCSSFVYVGVPCPCLHARLLHSSKPHASPAAFPHLADAVILGAALAGVGRRLPRWGGCVGHTVDGLGAAVAVLTSSALDQALALAVGRLQTQGQCACAVGRC